MSFEIDATDHARLHIFALSDTAAQRIEEADDKAAALHATFGLPLNPDFVDLVRIEALAGLPLADYLHQGYDIAQDSIDTSLNTPTGPLALLMSRAFNGQPARIDSGAEVEYLTSLTIPGTAPPAPMDSPDRAQGILDGAPAKKQVSNAAMSGRIATLALLVLFALVLVMILIAG